MQITNPTPCQDPQKEEKTSLHEVSAQITRSNWQVRNPGDSREVLHVHSIPLASSTVPEAQLAKIAANHEEGFATAKEGRYQRGQVAQSCSSCSKRSKACALLVSGVEEQVSIVGLWFSWQPTDSVNSEYTESTEAACWKVLSAFKALADVGEDIGNEE